MIIVADSSALVALAVCNGLHWLDTLYQQVRVPRACQGKRADYSNQALCDGYPTGKSIPQRRGGE